MIPHSKWMGPATVVDVRSPYSYTVEFYGVRRYFHANKLRKFHMRVDSVTCDSLVDDLESKSVNTCALVYENDTDFGQLNVIPSTLSQPSTVVLPSEKIDPGSHSFEPRSTIRAVRSTRSIPRVFFRCTGLY